MHRLAFFASLAVPLPMLAQEPVHYRVTSVTTSTTEKASFDTQIALLKASGIDATEALKTNGVNISKTISLISVTTHDSAGGKVWEITIDSNTNDPGPLTTALLKRMAITNPPPATSPTAAPRPAPPKTVNQVFVMNGKAMSLARNGRPSPTSLVAQHSALSLWAQLPGYALLIPNADLPATIGQVKADTFGTHTKTSASSGSVGNPGTGVGGSGISAMGVARAGTEVKASGLSAGGSSGSGGSDASGNVPMPTISATETSDTTIAEWKRLTADSVEANISRLRSTETNANISTAEITGFFRVMFDTKHDIRGAASNLTTTTTSTSLQSNSAPSVRVSSQEYSIVRIP